VISSLCGVLFVLSVSRIVIGVALAPRYASSPSWLNNPVYGNDIAQQITSTFDVVLCGLTLCILTVVVITGRLAQHRAPQSPEPETARLHTGRPRIFRGDNAPTQRLGPTPKIYRPGQR
jgi:ABC-type Fe3+ transport system permease subunit